MSTINVKVVDQQLTITNMPVIASGGVEEDYVAFSFDSTWSGYGKNCVFYRADDPDNKYDALVSNNKALVPFEVMLKPGKVYFGLVGSKGSTVLTSQVIWFMLDTGVYQKQSRAASEDIYTQVLKYAEEIAAGSIGDGDVTTAKLANGAVTTGKLGSSSVTKAKLASDVWAEVKNLVYPVGSIYISVNSTSPATLFGGTWEQVKDRFLLSSGTTYTAGATGGAANATLAYSNLPSRTVVSTKNTGTSTASIGYVASNSTSLAANAYGDVAIQDTTNMTNLSVNYGTGGQKAVSTMPPYLTVYMWKRTA